MSRPVLNGLDLNGKALDNVADPTTAQQAATKAYVDNQITARSPKDDVIVLTTSNVNLASPGATVDGVTMTTGMRFAAAGQTTGSQNGIYVWNGAAVAATRATDADTITDLSGAVFAVQRGTNADKLYLVTNDDTDTLGTTTINIVPTGAGTSYTAGAGLTLTGATFDVVGGPGVSVQADVVNLDFTVVARKISFSCAATTNPQSFTHSFNTQDVVVQVRRASDNVLVEADVVATDVNNVSVNFGGAPTASQYRVTVVG